MADHSERAHSELGGSIAKRWIRCPGSVRLCRAADPQEASEYAELGTAAHELAEQCLVLGEDAEDNIGEEFNGHIVDQNMADAVQVYLDYVAKNTAEGSKVYVERKFGLEWVHAGMFGSNDCCIWDPATKDLWVIDYKHGQGVTVEAEWNEQLLYYAAGAAAAVIQETGRSDAVENITLAIVQPRGQGDAIKEWGIHVRELNHWIVSVLMPAARATDEDDARLEVGDHCKWCAAAPNCPAQRQIARKQFDDGMKLPEQMTDEELGKVLEVADSMEAWFKQVRGYARNRLSSGLSVPGRKLVAGRNTRKWKNDLEAADVLEDILGDDAYARKLLTPAAAEKALGKERKGELAELIETVEGEPIMAPESSKKPAVCGTAAAQFLDAIDELN